jgi:hypothetical protein
MNARQNDMRMVDDLDQSDEVRSLLRAGIDDDVAGYDFKHGLSAHLAAVAALPPAVQTPHVPVEAAAAAGISGKALIAWIGVPVASATVMAALWIGGSVEPKTTPRLDRPAVEAPVAARGGKSASAASQKPTSAVTHGTESAPLAAEVEAPKPRTESQRAEQRRAIRAQRSAASIVIDHKPPALDQVAPAQAETIEAQAAVEVTTPEVVEPSAAERSELARQAAAQAEQERIAREEARRVAEERLKREMAQLMQAKQALTSNPARALSLAQAGEQEFRNSLFSEERQHVLLLALIKLGRVEEAERRAQPFLSTHPDSPFARRIRNALQDAK